MNRRRGQARRIGHCDQNYRGIRFSTTNRGAYRRPLLPTPGYQEVYPFYRGRNPTGVGLCGPAPSNLPDKTFQNPNHFVDNRNVSEENSQALLKLLGVSQVSTGAGSAIGVLTDSTIDIGNPNMNCYDPDMVLKMFRSLECKCCQEHFGYQSRTNKDELFCSIKCIERTHGDGDGQSAQKPAAHQAPLKETVSRQYLDVDQDANGDGQNAQQKPATHQMTIKETASRQYVGVDQDTNGNGQNAQQKPAAHQAPLKEAVSSRQYVDQNADGYYANGHRAFRPPKTYKSKSNLPLRPPIEDHDFGSKMGKEKVIPVRLQEMLPALGKEDVIVPRHLMIKGTGEDNHFKHKEEDSQSRRQASTFRDAQGNGQIQPNAGMLAPLPKVAGETVNVEATPKEENSDEVVVKQTPVMGLLSKYINWSLPLPLNQPVKVIPTHVTSFVDIYVQTNEMHNGIPKITSDLFDLINEGRLEYLREYDIGTPCVAPFEGDYYRAEIIESYSANVAIVFFSDFGNREQVMKESLYTLPKALAKVSRLIYQCVWDAGALDELSNEAKLEILAKEIFEITPKVQIAPGQYLVEIDGIKPKSDVKVVPAKP